MIKKILLVLIGFTVVIGNSFSFFNVGPLSFFPLRVIILGGFLYILIFKINIKINLKYDLFPLFFFFLLIFKSLYSLFFMEDATDKLSVLLIYLTAFSLILILMFLIIEEKDLQLLLLGYSIGVLSVSIIGIFESFTGNYIIYNTSYNYMSDTHTNFLDLNYPLAQFHNINNLATFLTLSIPLISMLNSDNKKAFIVFLKKITIVLSIINIILGESRGALFSLIIISIMLIINYFQTNKISIKFIYLLLLPFFVYFIPLALRRVLDSNLHQEVRIVIWIDMLVSLSETLFMGVGVGNSGSTISFMLNPELSQNSAAHNYLLEIFTEFGIVVFIIMILWLVSMYIKSTNLESKIFILLFIIMSIVPSTMLGMYFVWFGLAIVSSHLKLSKVNSK